MGHPKIDMILQWATNKPSFDTEFVEKLKDYYEEHQTLTNGQETALDNIIENFHIIESNSSASRNERRRRR